jgi:hypothetical protein
MLLLCSAGCASPGFTTQPVRSDPQIFVGLSSFQDRVEAAAVRHEHPVTWTEGDLRAILGRLLIQERGGLMDSTKPPRPVFTSEELARLIPALRQAFEAARPADWVAFVLSDRAAPTGPSLLTSGALAVEQRRLHMILANHREPVSTSMEEIRRSPFRPLRALRGGLTFDPPLYIVNTQTNWLGGTSGAAASELVLDYSAFLGTAQQGGPVGTDTPTAASDIDALRQEVSTLREDLAHLKQQLKEQADELARLRLIQPRKP